MTDELPFKVVRGNGTDEVLARRQSVDRSWPYREAARMYPEDLIELRQGARVKRHVVVGASPPNQVGVVHGGEDQHARETRWS